MATVLRTMRVEGASATAGAAWLDQLAVVLATRRQRRLAWLRDVVRSTRPAPTPFRFV